MNISTKISAWALCTMALFTTHATAETQENLFDFANNNLNLEVATPADWENPNLGVISGSEIRQGDVILTAVDGSKVNRMWRTNAGVTYLQVGGKITLTADAGRAIKNVTFTVQNYKFFLEVTNNGTIDASTFVWTGNASAVTFDNDNDNNPYGTQSLLLTMTVTTDDADENTITPSGAEYVDANNIAEFIDLPVGTHARLYLNNAQVNGVDYSAVYLEDESGAIELTDLSLNLLRNDIINGYIYVKRDQFYYDDDPDDDVPGRERPQATADELTDAETFMVTHDNQLTPTTFTEATLLNDENISKLIRIENVPVTKTGRFYFASINGEDVQVADDLFYLPQGATIPENGEHVNVSGIFTWNGLRYKIMLTDIEPTTVTAISDISTKKDDANSPVFTITGINLGNTDLQSLPAGIYIKGGKKIIIR